MMLCLRSRMPRHLLISYCLVLLITTTLTHPVAESGDHPSRSERSLTTRKRWDLPLGHQYIGLGKRPDDGFREMFTTDGKMTADDIDRVVGLINEQDENSDDDDDNDAEASNNRKYASKPRVGGQKQNGDTNGSDETDSVDFVTDRLKSKVSKVSTYLKEKRVRRRFRTYFDVPRRPHIARRMVTEHRSSPVNPVFHYLGIGR